MHTDGELLAVGTRVVACGDGDPHGDALGDTAPDVVRLCVTLGDALVLVEALALTQNDELPEKVAGRVVAGGDTDPVTHALGEDDAAPLALTVAHCDELCVVDALVLPLTDGEPLTVGA